MKPRFVQLRSPMTKSYIRIDRKLGRITGHRKKKYKCLLIKPEHNCDHSHLGISL